MSTAAADHRPRRVRRERRVRWGWIVLFVVLVLVAIAAWVGVRGLLAANDLRVALPAATRIQTAVLGGDSSAAATGIGDLRERADKAHSLTDDPVWRVVETTPWLGPNMRALSGVAASAATVTGGGLDSVASISGELSGGALKPNNGAIDLKPLADAAPALSKANTAVQSGAAMAASLSTKGVVAPLANAVTQYQGKIDEVAKLTDAASRASDLLPGMLGQNGPRTYLLLVLNNAELRASGGIPGSVVHITANRGKITFDQQASDGSFGPYNAPITELARPTNLLFTQITGEYMQDVTLTPHFDQTAQLAAAMWKQKYGQSVDGVISIDPVALKYILEATGAVTFGQGTSFDTQLTAQNVVTTLLSDVYSRFSSPPTQDQFFGAATNAIFAKVTSGDFAPSAMLTAFTHIGDEHRLNVWSSQPAEQTKLAQTTLSGGPARSGPGEQRFGVYLADGTGSKMDYYLHTSVSLGHITCQPDGPLYVVQLTLKNGVVPSKAGSLPAYVSGGGQYGVPVGTMRTQVTVYGSPGVEFGNAFTSTGAAQPVKYVRDGDRDVAQYTIDLKAGQSSTVRLLFNSKKGQTGTAAADVTPQINPVSISTGRFECATVLK
ncbi:DUF4012 domain-containing protein [Gryllotalpicola reticulitermitis]|uniref:DUF4012 domain-containing protein n=1 Tax=Gryllotalpicola reticulitermitis TaxID=1184153 RepID=A0ABV8Q4K8_9MICO